MKLLEKILVNIDLENANKDHIKIAEKLAEKFNSEIILLCVLPKEANLETLRNYVKSYTEEQLDKISKQLSYSKEKISKRVEYGNAFEMIISVSEMENVNLIINANNVEYNSKSEIKVDVLSEKLVRKSVKPVMIVKSGTSLIPNNILCPVDFSESSKRALNNAIKIARVFNSKLFIINVFEPLRESFSKRFEIDFKEENEKLNKANQRQLDEFLSTFNLIDVDYHVKSFTGKINEGIVDFALSNSIDFVYIGATGKNYVQRLLIGSVTENVLRRLPSSMIVMKAENLLDLKIESDISTIEKHFDQATKLEEAGYYLEAIEQLKTCLLINDLHLPVINRLSKIYEKIGDIEQSKNFQTKFNEVLRRLWDKKIEFEIRTNYKLNQ